MKQCPRCQQTYSDDNLNFCLTDGELLTAVTHEPRSAGYAEDPPPTMLMSEARVTNPTDWPSSPPQAQWQPPPVVGGQQQFGQYAMPMGPSQTLAIVSLCLGIGSITIGWCCSLGVLLSPAALITGFIALSQIRKDPARYSGRGMAIGGISTGAVYIAVFVLILIIYGAAALFGAFNNVH